MTTIRMGRALRVGAVEIVPIERTQVSVGDVAGQIVAFASREPVAVLIRTDEGSTVVDLDNGPVRLEDVLEEP